ncbi:AfsR/SARP family transcriptional regulator [Kitasatospora sp. DSM 101779]|uniref:AfsR/SARP family transcriptional regulator n=1 Tax=Kitasatospora sp. DSM 101779 TaxID=2853165 RepID=UPI0021D8F90F|nr:BTAD domain-containing putative transcriptional regulator [Kitasatospora sp. DSM 101779]MCU7827186.1 tetratricopeptide repeat protein [Kitasatospora sp. DSM 101779]
MRQRRDNGWIIGSSCGLSSHSSAPREAVQVLWGGWYVRFGLLGDLLIQDESGAAVPLASAHGRALLAALLLAPNRPVSRERLTSALWGDSPPPTAATALSNQVVRLRRVLGPHGGDRLQTVPSGYLLRIGPAELDTEEFIQAVAAADTARRQGDWHGASGSARCALGLWRGTPLGELPLLAEEALPSVRSFEEARLQAAEWFFEAELSLGRHASALVELTRWAALNPLHEGLHAHLVTALYRNGRQADALEAFEGIRARLAEELGVDPGPALRTVHQRVLQADPDFLQPPAPTAAVPQGVAGPAAAPECPTAPEPAEAEPASWPAPAQLPADISDFTGRADGLTALTSRLEAAASSAGTCVLAVSGMGGVGKTALAVHTAHRVRHLFPDGQLYVDLHGFGNAEPREAHDVVARFLGDLDSELRGTPLPTHTDDRSARLRSVLANRRVLLVLDNARDAEQVLPLLPGHGHCAVLITSRTTLTDLPGAVHVPLEPLDVDEQRDLLARVCGAERVNAEPNSALRLLAACGGLPLALRIATARLCSRPSWSLGLLADLLTGDGARLRTLAAGHLSVRTTLASSYLALRDSDDPVERDAARLFRLLGLWPGLMFGIKQASALAERPEHVTAELLETLVDFQLLQSPEPLRYRFHDLLSEFAAESALAEESREDRDTAQVRLMVWYCAALQNAARTLLPGVWRFAVLTEEPAAAPPDFADGPQVTAWCTQELSNITAVVRQAAASSRPDLAWRIASGLTCHMTADWWTGAADECRELALRTAEREDDLLGQALMLERIGVVHGSSDRYPEASDALTAALERAERAGRDNVTTSILKNLAALHNQLGDGKAALAYARRALELDEASREDSVMLTTMAAVHLKMADFASAEAGFRRAAGIWRRHGNLYNTAVALANLGDSLRALGRRDEALAALDEALHINEQLGNLKSTTDCLLITGRTHLHFRQWDEAAAAFQQAVDLAREQRLPAYVQEGIEGLDKLQRLRAGAPPA